jgi:hypothetical protein
MILPINRLVLEGKNREKLIEVRGIRGDDGGGRIEILSPLASRLTPHASLLLPFPSGTVFKPSHWISVEN